MAYVSLGSRSRPGFSSGGGSGGASGGGSAGYSSSGIGTSLLAAGRSASNASSDAMKPPAGKPCCEITCLTIMPFCAPTLACCSAASFHRILCCGPPSCVCWMACIQRCGHAECLSLWRAGYTPAASVIAPQDLTICKKSDGSDFLLGQGTFGAVSLTYSNLL